MEYKKQLAANLGQDGSARILAFKQKAPAPAEGFENHLASLYTANNGPRPKKTFRAVPQQPERILDAPDLVDDYYLNLLDWGSTNSVRDGVWQVGWLGAGGWAGGTATRQPCPPPPPPHTTAHPLPCPLLCPPPRRSPWL